MGVILVTGASSGIGESAARRLLKAGNTVWCAARRVERMKALEDAGARILRMDVTDEASINEGIDLILKESGRIDVLVNNAGYGYFGAMETVSLDEATAPLSQGIRSDAVPPCLETHARALFRRVLQEDIRIGPYVRT